MSEKRKAKKKLWEKREKREDTRKKHCKRPSLKRCRQENKMIQDGIKKMQIKKKKEKGKGKSSGYNQQRS